MRSLLTALALSLFSLTASAEPVNYTLDMSHSSIGFKVRHMMVTNLSGRFKEVDKAIIKLDEQDLTKSEVSIEIKTASVSTDNEERDKHLRKPDFLDAEKYKVIKFDSKKIVKTGPQNYKMTGDLTIRGVMKPVTLDAEVSAPVKSPWNQLVRGITLTGAIKRSEFGVATEDKKIDVLIGEDVKLVIEAEVNKPAAAPPPAATPPAAPPSKPPAATPPSKPPATTPPAAPQPKPPAATPPKPPAAPTPPAAPKAPAQPKPKQ